MEVINAVTGYKWEFDSKPIQRNKPCEAIFGKQEHNAIKLEIQKLLDTGVVVPSRNEENQFVSRIFTRPKKDGSVRMILNLKNFNKHIIYKHFKMETFKSALPLIEKDSYMASVDLKSAYYTVPIHAEFQKYLKFEFEGQLYTMTALPNGLGPAPRIFTKICKPVFAKLRRSGHKSVSFIDDILCIGLSAEECYTNVRDTALMFDNLGFIIHPEKSEFVPSKTAVFLGFVINSADMCISLSVAKAEDIIASCKYLLAKPHPTIREVSQTVGKLVASFPAVRYAPLYYRQLENDKIAALKRSWGNFDAHMCMSEISVHDLQWFIKNVKSASKPIRESQPDVIIASDASDLGWGGVMHNTCLTAGPGFSNV